MAETVNDTFKIQIQVDGTTHTVPVNAAVVEMINSEDPATRQAGMKIICDSFHNQRNVMQQSSKTESEENGSLLELWSKPQTLLLIELYKERNEKFQNPLLKKKTLWEEIAKEMNLQAYNYTSKQIEGRWKTLTAAYRRVKDNNKSTGKARKNFEYESHLDEIFSERHDTKPSFTISSSTCSSSGGSEVAESSESGEPSEKKGLHKTKRKSQSASSQVLKFLKDYGEQEDKREKERMEKAQKMHDEKMSLFQSFLDVLKK